MHLCKNYIYACLYEKLEKDGKASLKACSNHDIKINKKYLTFAEPFLLADTVLNMYQLINPHNNPTMGILISLFATRGESSLLLYNFRIEHFISIAKL